MGWGGRELCVEEVGRNVGRVKVPWTGSVGGRGTRLTSTGRHWAHVASAPVSGIDHELEICGLRFEVRLYSPYG